MVDRVEHVQQLHGPSSPHLHAVHRAHASARLAPFVTASVSAAPDFTRRASRVELARRAITVEDCGAFVRSSRGPPVG